MRRFIRDQLKDPRFGSAKGNLEKNENGYLVRKNTGDLYHRWLYHQFIGNIPTAWDVHHIDGDKLNNRLDNLFALPRKLHYKIHREYLLKKLPNKIQLESLLPDWIKVSDSLLQKRQRHLDEIKKIDSSLKRMGVEIDTSVDCVADKTLNLANRQGRNP